MVLAISQSQATYTIDAILSKGTLFLCSFLIFPGFIEIITEFINPFSLFNKYVNLDVVLHVGLSRMGKKRMMLLLASIFHL